MEVGEEMIRFLHWISKFLPLREIRAEDGILYLERYRIFGWMPDSKFNWPVSLYLHRFHLPDQDPLPHIHPWSFSCSLILVGGYLEQRIGRDGNLTEIERVPFRLNVIRKRDFHRVAALRGSETWTLFLTVYKRQTWGFLHPKRGFIPWRDRLAERQIPTEI